MPIRLARLADTAIMADVLAASFGPDRLFEVMFPYKDQHWNDFVKHWRRNLRVSWWDYSKVLMVSYEEIIPDEVDTEQQHLLTTRNGHYEIITGVAEWGRVGLGWQHVWNVWRWLDPRCLIHKVVGLANKIAYFFRPCRASAYATEEEPNPLQFWNFVPRIIPFSDHLLRNPLIPWRANHWMLDILAIDPSCQGQGIGKELVEWGLARAKSDTASGMVGVPAVVIAAEHKERFYQKVGFNELVGWSSRSVEGVPGINPLEEKGVGGGAVLWTWVADDQKAAKEKVREFAKS